jgi:hypothetical protein
MENFNGRPSSLSNRSQAEIRTYDFLDKLGISYTTVCHAPAANHPYRPVSLPANPA